MENVVIDASVAVKWVVNEEFSENAIQLLKDVKENGTMMIAPPMFDFEVESALQNRLYRDEITENIVDESLKVFYEIGVIVETHDKLTLKAREIARKFNQRAIYDSAYAALAMLNGCEFWTADYEFFKKAITAISNIKFIGDYAC